jgi:hypothetical protein
MPDLITEIVRRSDRAKALSFCPNDCKALAFIRLAFIRLMPQKALYSLMQYPDGL